jgi:hypothetical protein
MDGWMDGWMDEWMDIHRWFEFQSGLTSLPGDKTVFFKAVFRLKMHHFAKTGSGQT